MHVHYHSLSLLAKGHPMTWRREGIQLMFSEQKSE